MYLRVGELSPGPQFLRILVESDAPVNGFCDALHDGAYGGEVGDDSGVHGVHAHGGGDGDHHLHGFHPYVDHSAQVADALGQLQMTVDDRVHIVL